MSGSDSNKSTTVQTQNLPAGVSGALNKSMGAAQSLYDSGSLFKPNTSSTVVPFSPVTERGIRGASDDAYNSRPAFQSVFNNLSAIGNSDGLNDNQRQALGIFGDIARMDGTQDPNFRAVVDQGVDAARDSVNMSASGMGRTGSGVHQGVLAKETGDLASRMYAQQYNTDITNRMSAAGDMFNGYQQGQTNAAAARTALPGAYQSLQGLNDTAMSLGSMYEDLNRRQIDDSLRIQQEQQAQPKQAIEWLNAMATGAGNLGGSTQTTSQAPKPSPFMTGLGGGIAGATAFGPIGGLIGGGAGLLGGLF